MRGSIYSRQRCSLCGSLFFYTGRRGLFCPSHPDQQATGDFYVSFGRKVQKRFKDFLSAERFLDGLRYESDKGTFDFRDYQKCAPLGFRSLVEKYLTMKEQQIKASSHREIKRFLFSAVAAWGDRNIKSIGFGDLEDFIFGYPASSKTRANIKTCLHSFFRWIEHRERGAYRIPDFPEVNFTLGYRKILDKESQEAVIEEVRRLTYDLNPRIWLGIKWLSTYISIRPAEMISVKEGELDRKTGHFFIPNPKENRFKVVPMLPEDIELVRSLPVGLPDLSFFRHTKGGSGCCPGQPFGQKYFYKWWKKACVNLGIEGVDLYGGTKHSTATALRAVLSPEQIQRGAKISTNKAFQRYLQMNDQDALDVYRSALTLTKIAQHPHNASGVLTKKKL